MIIPFRAGLFRDTPQFVPKVTKSVPFAFSWDLSRDPPLHLLQQMSFSCFFSLERGVTSRVTKFQPLPLGNQHTTPANALKDENRQTTGSFPLAHRQGASRCESSAAARAAAKTARHGRLCFHRADFSNRGLPFGLLMENILEQRVGRRQTLYKFVGFGSFPTPNARD